jgi:hypothetical protein
MTTSRAVLMGGQQDGAMLATFVEAAAQVDLKKLKSPCLHQETRYE